MFSLNTRDQKVCNLLKERANSHSNMSSNLSHSIWRLAEQVHQLLSDLSCLFRPEKGQVQVFERMTGPDLQNKEMMSAIPGMFYSSTPYSASCQLPGEGQTVTCNLPCAGGAVPQMTRAWLCQTWSRFCAPGRLLSTGLQMQASSLLKCCGGKKSESNIHSSAL